MRARSLAVVLSLLLSGTACHQEEVVVRTAEGQESALGRYASFGILLPDPEELKEEGMKIETLQQIASLAIEQMQQRGYQPRPPQEADLLIVFGPRVQIYGTTRVNSDTGHSNDKYDRTMHAQGTLTVVFVDPKTRAIVWKRVAETRLLMGGPSEEKMRTGVAQIFEGVPRAATAAAPAAAATTSVAAAPASSAEASSAPPSSGPPETAEATPAPKP
jgi:hypothetical protein